MLHQPPGGIDHGAARTQIQACLDCLAYRHCDLLLVASGLLAEDLTARGVPPSLIRIVPPGRDVVFETNPDSASPEKAPDTPVAPPAPTQNDMRLGRRAAFLCVSNWVERKGIHSLLDAFARLPAAAGTLHLVGDPDADPGYRTRIRARLASPALVARVVVHGSVSLTEVARLYSAADVFVLPSIKEPYGTVYGEAMAYGLPVVGWRAGNLPYLAEDGVEGLLAAPGDVASLAGALARLAFDAPYRQRLGAAAQARALSRPTWQQSAALFFGTIREAVGTARHSPAQGEEWA
jgi:glycosyltransferase involved in cell wall biosynthesis